MASDLDSSKAEIASLRRKIEAVEAKIDKVEAKIDKVEAKQGIWSEVPTTEWLSHLDTLLKDKISLHNDKISLQEEKIILLKQTAATGKSHVQFLLIRSHSVFIFPSSIQSSPSCLSSSASSLTLLSILCYTVLLFVP